MAIMPTTITIKANCRVSDEASNCDTVSNSPIEICDNPLSHRFPFYSYSNPLNFLEYKG